MLFKTADWDDSGLTHNALATETKFLSYKLTHEFNRPARATVTLSDPDGSTAQKYDVDAAGDSVYVGPGRAYIEDPTGIAVFEGRIVRAISDMQNHRLILECEDWLSQLDDDKIVYDMREDLDPLDAGGVQGLRQSETHTDPNNSKPHLRRPVVRSLYGAVADDGGAQTDETAEANDQTADDMTLLPAVPAIGDAYYFGFETKVSGFSLYISQQGNWAGTITWYYWDGAAWSGLVDLLPSDSASKNFEVSGQVDYTWTVQGDWATTAVDGITAYWVKAEVTSYTGVTTQPLGRDAWAEYWLYDDDMSFTADDYNGMYVVLAGGMAGTQTIGSGPWMVTATEHNDGLDSGGTWANSYTTWYYDGIYDLAVDNDSSYELDYEFSFPFINSSLLQTGSISEIRLKTALYFGATDSTATVQIDDKTDGWIDIEELNPDGVVRYYQLVIPPNKLSDVFDSDGNLTIRVDVDWTSGTATVQIDYLWVEIDCITTGYSSAISITDTQTNRLLVGTDPTATANRIWEGCPYSIVRPIYKHIASDESPGGLIDDGDTLYALTAAATIEHTTGLSLRHYHERSRLEILKDLAEQDNSVFWITLGGTTVTWKSTFNDGAPTAMTDASVLRWVSGDWNYKSMFNEFHIYGATIGDHQLTADTSDATSQATYGIARTGVVTQSGVFSQYDCTQLASKLVTRNKDTNLYLEAEIGGLSTLRLGDEVSITSSYLGLTAEKYTVTHWAYDSPTYRTLIRLHPRASTTGYQENIAITEWRRSLEGQREIQSDLYIPDLTTQTWS
jgi:hypothetical protein